MHKKITLSTLLIGVMSYSHADVIGFTPEVAKRGEVVNFSWGIVGD